MIIITISYNYHGVDRKERSNGFSRLSEIGSEKTMVSWEINSWFLHNMVIKKLLRMHGKPPRKKDAMCPF